MRLLLDTHIFLWAVADKPELKLKARQIIEEAEAVYVSAASLWEIATKVRLGKLQADLDELVGAIEAGGFIELPVRAAHTVEVSRLALHHNDPFDRLLIAQATLEPLKLMTADAALVPYTDLVMLV
jgi:PIN domain nuclease of toxin-antitoxin system